MSSYRFAEYDAMNIIHVKIHIKRVGERQLYGNQDIYVTMGGKPLRGEGNFSLKLKNMKELSDFVKEFCNELIDNYSKSVEVHLIEKKR